MSLFKSPRTCYGAASMSTHGVTSNRITFNVSQDQLVWLNDLAQRYGIAVSDVMRRLIDETRGAYITPAAARVSRTGYEGVTEVS
jgi:hypothetical protein